MITSLNIPNKLFYAVDKQPFFSQESWIFE